MNRKSKLLNIMSVFLLFSFGSVSVVNVADQPVRRVGVKVGDWAKYGEFRVTWSSNGEAKPHQELIDANKTEWVHISVYSVTFADTRISFQETTHFTNGTEKQASKDVDVDSGWGNGALTFISAGLKKGDPLYSSEEGALLKINETIFRTYIGISRETNVLNLTRTMIQDEPPQVVDVSVTYFWDRAAGILTERQASAINKTGSYVTSWSRSDRIIDTNLWKSAQTTNEKPPYEIIGTITLFLIVIGGLGFWLQKRSQSKTRKSHSHRR